MKRKKMLLLLSLFIVSLLLTACGQKDVIPEAFDANTYSDALESLTLTVLKSSDTELRISANEEAEPFNSLASGILTAKEEAGDPIEVEESYVTTSEDTVTVVVVVRHEERNVNYEYTYEPNPSAEYNPNAPAYSLIQIVVMPQYTIGELMQEAGINTLMGMGIVFLVLIFISCIISLFRFLPGSGAKKAAAKQTEKTVQPAPTQAVQPQPENPMENAQLVAVITAAVLAANGSDTQNTLTSSDTLIVRSIKRVSR